MGLFLPYFCAFGLGRSKLLALLFLAPGRSLVVILVRVHSGGGDVTCFFGEGVGCDRECCAA